jgi:hypothetical protein
MTINISKVIWINIFIKVGIIKFIAKFFYNTLILSI